jgi:polysaccharide export outer membrane protein
MKGFDLRASKISALAATALLGLVPPAYAQAPANGQPADAPVRAPAPSAQTPMESFAVVDANYVLGVGDVIEVAVVGQPDYSVRARISPDGAVMLPLVGRVTASSRRPSELATQVAAGLTSGGYFAQPIVRVEVVTVASRFVTVLGQVGSPGLMPLDRTYRLSEILARAGARFATGAELVIITRANGTQEKLIMADIAMGDPAKDPVVVTGDKIYLPAPGSQVFYINGSVRSPGSFPVTPGLTVRLALARAGGVSENGSEKKFDIIRGGKKVPKTNLETVIEEGDIIKFGERMF